MLGDAQNYIPSHSALDSLFVKCCFCDVIVLVIKKKKKSAVYSLVVLQERAPKECLQIICVYICVYISVYIYKYICKYKYIRACLCASPQLIRSKNRNGA